MQWLSFVTFDLPLVQIMFTLNKVLAKIILKLIAVNLMIYFNSIKLREASITLTSFIQKRENYSDFLCMNAMHISGFSLFLSSNVGMLHLVHSRSILEPGSCIKMEQVSLL